SLVRGPGPFGQERAAVEAGFFAPRVELRPALRGRAVRARRVDEEDTGLFAHATATSSASVVMRSTAARSSSSVTRANEPSTIMSLTVSRHAASTLYSAAMVKSAAASISPPSTPRADQRPYWPSAGL